MAGRQPRIDENIASIGHHTNSAAKQYATELKPNDLSASHSLIWDRVAPELYKVNRLKPLYIDVLLEYCMVTALMLELRLFIANNGATYKVQGRNGVQIKARPEIARLNESFRQWNSLVGHLGLSPATEQKFNNKQLGLNLDDDWNDL